MKILIAKVGYPFGCDSAILIKKAAVITKKRKKKQNDCKWNILKGQVLVKFLMIVQVLRKLGFFTQSK